MQPDDMCIPNSYEIAGVKGFTFEIGTITLKDAHPNTAVIRLTGVNGRKIEMQASSVGGGSIKVTYFNGIYDVAD